MLSLPSTLSLSEAVYWAYLTVRRDRRHYVPFPRPITTERLRASLRPVVRRPIFIIGAPRSGTTFLGRCIGALPEVAYHFEPAAIQRSVQHVYRGTWSEREAQHAYTVVYRWLLRLHLDGDRRLADKTPRHCFIVPFLYRTFPDATFVHIVRDGRDAALSHSKKPWLQQAMEGAEQYGVGGNRFGPYPRFWVRPERERAFRTTTDYHRCIWAWKRHVEAAREGLADVPADQQHTMRYADWVRHPMREGGRLLDALGIAPEPSRQRLLATASTAHTRSVGAWRTELTAQQRAIATHEAGDLLEWVGGAASSPV